MKKIQLTNLSNISDTLFISLLGRAIAAERFPELGFVDPYAEEIVKRIDFNFNQFIKDNEAMKASALRAKLFDGIVIEFFKRNPEGLAIQLGSGLCSRFKRVDNGKLKWVDLDLPEVIELKKQFVPENDRFKYLAFSVLDYQWLEKIDIIPDTPVIIIAEGLLIYLKQEDVNCLLKSICDKFIHFSADVELVFDAFHRLMVNRYIQKLQKSVRKTGAKFQWGIYNLEEIISSHKKLILIADLELIKHIRLRLNIISRLFNVLSSGQKLYRILHFKVENNSN
ncbi:MAG: class I SAM-dependent methyltransferase [Cyanobacteriota bacterium]